MRLSPCKGCRFRSVRPNCHDTCEPYREFNAEREAMRKHRKTESIFWDYLKARKHANRRK